MIHNRRIRNFTRNLMASTCLLLMIFGVSVYLFTSRLQMVHFNEIGKNYTQFVGNILKELTKADLEHGYVIANNDDVINYVRDPKNIVFEFHAKRYLNQVIVPLDELESAAIISYKDREEYVVNNDDQHDILVGERFFDLHSYYMTSVSSVDKSYYIQISVRYENVIQGVISFKFGFSSFEEQFVKENQYQSTGAFLIVDSKGQVIVKSDVFTDDVDFGLIIDNAKSDEHIVEHGNRAYYVDHVDTLSDEKMYFVFTQELSELFYMRQRIVVFTVFMIIGLIVVYSGFSFFSGKYYNRLIIEDTKMVVDETVDREVEAQTKVLRKQARRDSLTQIYNHAVLIELLEEMSLSDRLLTILMIDIDYFKAVNDNFGHLAGDDVLVELSQLLLQTIRSEDAVGRYGGEEFMIILRDTDIKMGYKIAERIRKDVMHRTFSNEKIQITVSIGLAQYDDEDVSSLIKRADKNLYQSKADGRNKTTY